MAGIMDSINKGFATINLKTSNLVESTKLKTAISTRENEIAALMKSIGETVYAKRCSFSIEMIKDMIEEIGVKYSEIEDFRNQITLLEENEKTILGSSVTGNSEAKIYCIYCGSPNKIGGRFCEKCGSKLEE